jgi:hypothetical protein
MRRAKSEFCEPVQDGSIDNATQPLATVRRDCGNHMQLAFAAIALPTPRASCSNGKSLVRNNEDQVVGAEAVVV